MGQKVHCAYKTIYSPHSEHGPFLRKEVSHQLELMNIPEISASGASQCVAHILQVYPKY